MALFLLEVSGTRKDFTCLRKWLRLRHYSSQMVCGGGRSGSAPKNGIVVAVDEKQGKLRSTRRVAARVLGAEVMCSADGHTRRFAAIHGLNEETKREIRYVDKFFGFFALAGALGARERERESLKELPRSAAQCSAA